MHGMGHFKVKLACSRHESTSGIRSVRPPTLNLGTTCSGHLHAPDALTRVLIEQKAWWVPSQSKRCGSRISNSACPTRSPNTSSAELQKLIIKWQENEPGNLTNLLAVPYPSFLFTGWTMEYVYHTTWKQKRVFPSFTYECDMWWNLIHRNQTTTDRVWNICVGFDTDSAPLKDSNCNKFHKCLLHAISRSKSSDPNFPTTKANRYWQTHVPEWNSVYGQPSHSSYKQKRKWPLPGTNNSDWWCENSRRSFTLQDCFISQPFQTTLLWC